jgi:hypothetical protein
VTVRTHAPTPQDVDVTTKSSSTAPLQSSSTPSQLASLAAGAPGWHELTTAPFTQVMPPNAPHAPTPHEVGVVAKSSSTLPLQSSSTPLQVASFAAGVPGVQELTSAPLTQLLAPTAAQAPTPHAVAVGT